MATNLLLLEESYILAQLGLERTAVDQAHLCSTICCYMASKLLRACCNPRRGRPAVASVADRATCGVQEFEPILLFIIIIYNVLRF